LLTLLTTASSLSPPHPAAPEPYPLSLHDALPISFPSGDEDAAAAQRRRGRDVREPISHKPGAGEVDPQRRGRVPEQLRPRLAALDRKSTRLNSSHGSISYAVFCLKKKKNN